MSILPTSIKKSLSTTDLTEEYPQIPRNSSLFNLSLESVNLRKRSSGQTTKESYLSNLSPRMVRRRSTTNIRFFITPILLFLFVTVSLFTQKYALWGPHGIIGYDKVPSKPFESPFNLNSANFDPDFSPYKHWPLWPLIENDPYHQFHSIPDRFSEDHSHSSPWDIAHPWPDEFRKIVSPVYPKDYKPIFIDTNTQKCSTQHFQYPQVPIILDRSINLENEWRIAAQSLQFSKTKPFSTSPDENISNITPLQISCDAKILVLMGSILYWNLDGHDGRAVNVIQQWADFITSLKFLGYSPVIPTVPSDVSSQFDQYDLIFTDYPGATRHWNSLQVISNRLFILETFGTDAEYNSQTSLAKSKFPKCCLGIELHHFLTEVQTQNNNKFLGRVVPLTSHLQYLASTRNIQPVTRLQAVIWGGDGLDIAKSAPFLKVISNMGIALYSTATKNTEDIPSFIHNVGRLSALKYSSLLHDSLFYIGTQGPLLGNGGFDALLSGCIVLLPVFEPELPLDEYPTNLKLSTRHPDLEKIGSPFVFSFNPYDLDGVGDLISTVQTIAPYLHQFGGYFDYSLSTRGMLENVAQIVEEGLLSQS